VASGSPEAWRGCSELSLVAEDLLPENRNQGPGPHLVDEHVVTAPLLKGEHRRIHRSVYLACHLQAGVVHRPQLRGADDKHVDIGRRGTGEVGQTLSERPEDRHCLNTGDMLEGPV